MADKLSRLGQTIQTEWSLHPEVFQAICSGWHQPQVDLFATRFNNKLPQFVSPVPDPQAWAVGTLLGRTRSWSLSPSRKLLTRTSHLPLSPRGSTVILCYELSDQEAHTMHQVKAPDVRAFTVSKAFQSGVSVEQILSACHWKSHNTFTQFCLKDVAWADSELFHLGPVVAAQQVHNQPQI